MADQPRVRLSDMDLVAALRGLADAIAWPAAAATSDGPDLAGVVRARIESGDAPPATRPSLWSRPVRRALALAVIVVLALAALAGAATLGLPGLRLILGPAPVSPPPSLQPIPSGPASVPGSTLGLGDRVDLAGLDERAGFAVRWPTDPLLGPPDVAYLDPELGGQVALVWATRPDLPATLQTGVGAVLTQFRGVVENGYFQKAISGGTVVEPVTVAGRPAFWVSGDAHFLFYTSPDGQIFDERRWVGDALLWADGPITYRLETSLGREHAIEIAESVP